MTAWHVLHVRPRCEKKAAAQCARLGLAHYLPLRLETRVYQRRRVTVDRPVFRGYLFAQLDEDRRARLLAGGAVARVIEADDQARLLRDLDQVRRALAADPALGAERGLKPGRRVRITTGPFMGLEGIVQKVRGATRVMLAVEMIGRGLLLDAETALLEPLE